MRAEAIHRPVRGSGFDELFDTLRLGLAQAISVRRESGGIRWYL